MVDSGEKTGRTLPYMQGVAIIAMYIDVVITTLGFFLKWRQSDCI